MNCEEAIALADNALVETEARHLTDVEMAIIYGAWHGKTYEEMAETTEYSANYLQRTVGHKLWKLLSKALEEEIKKTNFKNALERKKRLLKQGEINSKTQQIFPELPDYIERPPIEERCCQEITKPGALIRIKAPEGMGKTSLSSRILNYAYKLNYQTIFFNIYLADKTNFSSPDTFLKWFCVMVGRGMGLDNKLQDYWDDDFSSSKVNCTDYFEKYLLAQIENPLVLCLDPVERVFPYGEVAEVFFSLLRIWHDNAKVQDLWKKLRLIIVHSTEIYADLDINSSPFGNVGLPIKLPGFTQTQVEKLAANQGLNLTEDKIKNLMALVGGYPSLIQQAFSYIKNYGKMSSEEQFLEELLRNAPTEAGIYREHLLGILDRLQKYPELLEAFKKVLTEEDAVRLDWMQAYKLEGMGLVEMRGNDCKVRYNLYRRYFSDRLGIDYDQT